MAEPHIVYGPVRPYIYWRGKAFSHATFSDGSLRIVRVPEGDKPQSKETS